MPPKDKKDQTPLTPEELGLLKLWIDAGRQGRLGRERRAGPADRAGHAAPRRPADRRRRPDGRRRAASPPAGPTSSRSTTSTRAWRSSRSAATRTSSSRSGSAPTAGGWPPAAIRSSRSGTSRPAACKTTFTGHTDQVKALAVSADGKTGSSRAASTRPSGSGTSPRASRPASSPAPHRSWPWPSAPDGKTLARRRLGQARPHPERRRRQGTARSQGAHRAGRRRRLPAATAGAWSLGLGRRHRRGSGRLPEPKATATSPPTRSCSTGHNGPLRAVAVTPDGRTIVTGGRRRRRSGSGTPATARPSRTIDGHPARGARAGRQPRGRHAPDRLGRQDGAALSTCAGGTLRQTLTGHARPRSRRSPSAPTAIGWRRRGPTAGSRSGRRPAGQGVIAFGHTAPKDGPRSSRSRRSPSPPTARSSRPRPTRRSRAGRSRGPGPRWKPLGPHVFRVLAIDFNPDGTLLATGGGEPSRSGEVKLWEVGKGHARPIARRAPLRHRLRRPVQPRRHQARHRRGRQVPQGRRGSPTARS